MELGAWDRNGRILEQYREQSRSPVRALLAILHVQMRRSPESITDTGSTSRYITANSAGFDITAARNDGTHGIVIGTGSTAVDVGDTALVTAIAAGSGAGQIIHQTSAFSESSINVGSSTADFSAYRNFNNNSGGSITVQETGIVSKAIGASWYFLLVRDVPASLAVPDGGGCYVKYTLQISE